MNHSMYGTQYLDSDGLVQLGGQSKCYINDMSIYQTGTIVSHDSTIALQKFDFASAHPDSCDFIIQALRVWSYDGQPHTGITVGEIIDWDIPSDSNHAINLSGSNESLKLIYLQGNELLDTLGDGTIQCQDNDTRFGGMSFIESYLNDELYKSLPYSAYVSVNEATNKSSVTLQNNEEFQFMNQSGYNNFTQAQEDYHLGFCFESSIDIGIEDEYIAFIILASVQNGTEVDLTNVIDKARAWYDNNNLMETIPLILNNEICTGCCQLRGNIDGDPIPSLDIADIVYFVEYQFDQPPGPPPACLD